MIIIGLGANLDGKYGSPEQCLKTCSHLFSDQGVFVVSSSNIWKSAPVPMSDQPWYRNAVCVVNTEHSPYKLLSILSEIEQEAGRERGELNAARVLDLDLLAYKNEIRLEDPILDLPHPRMHERAFVLYPLQEIAPYWIHPVLNKSVEEMIKEMPSGQKIECIEDSNILCTCKDNRCDGLPN